MKNKLKVMTIVGTRPEIIRLACLIKKLDQHVEHYMVHTGQNSHSMLMDVFFDDLDLRQPDVYLNCTNESVGAFMGQVMSQVDLLLDDKKPDAVVILGDTNSAVSAIVAERKGIPVYHLEAGNRSFDHRVPEELNRKMVDHVASFNLPYNDYSERNLLAEGIHPRFICKTGSPLFELVEEYRAQIQASTAVEDLGLESKHYFVASVHRQENVDSAERLGAIMQTLEDVAKNWSLPVVLSVHPRTRKMLDAHSIVPSDHVRMLEPLGYLDYNKLQISSLAVLSDSGTISEEAAILGFPAVTLRESFERQESLPSALLPVAGVHSANVLRSLEFVLSDRTVPPVPQGYGSTNFSDIVLNFILSNVAFRQLQDKMG